MKVRLADSRGFCFGVEDAIERAEAAVSEHGAGNVVALGPVIHNKQVVEKIHAWDIDLLIMGELEPVLSRSDTYHDEAELIFRKAKCSVLVVKDLERMERLYETLE